MSKDVTLYTERAQVRSFLSLLRPGLDYLGRRWPNGGYDSGITDHQNRKLLALDPSTATARDINTILGKRWRRWWVTKYKCDLCEKRSWAVAKIDDFMSGWWVEAQDALVCRACIAAMVAALDAQELPQEARRLRKQQRERRST